MKTKEFFDVLYPRFDTKNSKIQIFLIDIYKKRGEKGHIAWEFFTKLEAAANYAKEMDKKGHYHVYFRCPELKSSASTGTEKDIQSHPFLYADMDAKIKDHEGNVIETFTKEQLMQRIKAFPLSPSIIVDSGNGYHVYWKLTIPLHEIERVKFLLSAIQELLGGDSRATLATQLLRVPNTHNRKNELSGEEPVLVKVVERNSKTYILKDFITALDIQEEDIYDLKTSLTTSTPKVTKTTVYTGNDVINFDFTKKITPLNEKVDNFIDLLELIKKQNILLASNINPAHLGKTFKCCFHKDENPSANVFISRNGHYLYKCFGCDRTYDIIAIYKELTNKNFVECLQDLADFFGIKYEQSEWAKEQINKYHQNLVTLINFEKYDYKEMYPNFYKLFNSRSHYLYYLNSFGLGYVRSEKESYEGENIFYISFDHFTKVFAKNRVTRKSAERYINLFCTLGLIKKVPLKKVPKKMAAEALEQAKKITESINRRNGRTIIREAKPSNFYIIYNIHDRLSLAEERAKKLLENGFLISKTMNKEFLIIALGQTVADEVYPDDRVISRKSLSLANRFESTLLKLINEQGYATKRQIITKTKVSGRLKVSRSDKEKQLEKHLTKILNNHNLEYTRANKKLMAEFGLKKSIYIIIPKGMKE